MGQRVGKYKVSKRDHDLLLDDASTITTSGTQLALSSWCTALGGVHVGGASDPGDDNLVVDGVSTLTGAVTATAGVTCGANSATRGTLTLWDGSGGNQPAYVQFHSRNGTAHYLFFEDDGTLKTHTSAPAANSDGSEIGGQT